MIVDSQIKYKSTLFKHFIPTSFRLKKYAKFYYCIFSLILTELVFIMYPALLVIQSFNILLWMK